ncbi:hypothetical protein AB0I52_21770 [Streptomyces sp. NPDC050423]|uniref:hypothetical protein n=1 Tax=Streptomyces sp. NPDC050423 TaxID=3155402 RepID=UPI00343E58C3
MIAIRGGTQGRVPLDPVPLEPLVPLCFPVHEHTLDSAVYSGEFLGFAGKGISLALGELLAEHVVGDGGEWDRTASAAA